MNSYILQFHVNKQAHLNQLPLMYSNSMQQHLTMTSYVLQFHVIKKKKENKRRAHLTKNSYVFQFFGNKHAHLNELHPFHIPSLIMLRY